MATDTLTIAAAVAGPHPRPRRSDRSPARQAPSGLAALGSRAVALCRSMVSGMLEDVGVRTVGP